MTGTGLQRALLRVGSIALFAVLPVFALVFVVVDLATGSAGWALREAFLPAADAVAEGESPYPGSVDDPSLARGTAYVYPPVLAQALIPLTAVPETVAVVAFALLLVAAAAGTLALLGVTDWRCYGVAFLWPPVLSAVHVENITLLMALAAALVWRFRERRAGGVSLGVSLAVFDASGRRRSERHLERLPAGGHVLRWNPGLSTPGVYFVRFVIKILPSMSRAHSWRNRARGGRRPGPLH